MRFCIDALGAAQYPEVIIKCVPREIGIGIFHSEFDKGAKTGFRAVQQFAKAGFTFFRVQMIWDKDHQYGDKYIPQLKQIAALYQKFATNHPDCTVQLSPFCEHRLPNPDKYLGIVENNAIACIPINCPIDNGKKSNVFVDEVHGEDAHPDGNHNFSFDGSDCIDTDIQSIKDHMDNGGIENFFFWRPRFNLHSQMGDPTRNTPPDSTYLKQVLALIPDKGPTNLPHDAIWKSCSEKSFPVLITPIKTDKVLLKQGDNIIATMPYYGPYVDGRSRYYSLLQGYQLGVCDIWINGEKYGTINGPFRSNAYR